jgi:hypothetical protein
MLFEFGNLAWPTSAVCFGPPLGTLMLRCSVLLERSPEGVAEAEPSTQGLLFRLLPQGSAEAIRL